MTKNYFPYTGKEKEVVILLNQTDVKIILEGAGVTV